MVTISFKCSSLNLSIVFRLIVQFLAIDFLQVKIYVSLIFFQEYHLFLSQSSIVASSFTIDTLALTHAPKAEEVSYTSYGGSTLPTF